MFYSYGGPMQQHYGTNLQQGNNLILPTYPNQSPNYSILPTSRGTFSPQLPEYPQTTKHDPSKPEQVDISKQELSKIIETMDNKDEVLRCIRALVKDQSNQDLIGKLAQVFKDQTNRTKISDILKLLNMKEALLSLQERYLKDTILTEPLVPQITTTQVPVASAKIISPSPVTASTVPVVAPAVPYVAGVGISSTSRKDPRIKP